MKFLSRTIASRNAASFMLAVWLFVLASGIANACLLEASDHGHRPPSEGSPTIANVAVMEHEHERSSKAPCLKACDDGARALQSSHVMDSIDPGFPSLAIVIWTGAVPRAVRDRSVFANPPSLSDPPARIIYSRWAL